MQVFALVDGNSFFASCEKVFRPETSREKVCKNLEVFG